MYHTEFADNAMQKMKSLPIRESSIFFGKFVLTSIMSVVVLAIEAASIAFCVSHWFEIGNDFWLELGKNFGYSFLLMLPCVLLSLLISSACKNMWVSLGTVSYTHLDVYKRQVKGSSRENNSSIFCY